MSYDLAFWYEEKAINAEVAYQKYAAMADGESGIVTEHPGVAEFYLDTLQDYPDLSEENAEESPWSSPVYCTGECVLVAISWSRKDEVSTLLIAMAQNKGLLTYDPQKEEVIQRG
ncbi:hypothetical protein [Streptomyces sp. AK08-02]|uniref:hypothetical protein n=1 Tax=Streptomyces sp. AK08-02 TaxID=3028654 RepID=UPI0029BF9D5C|nr:hypothetical protein [Streptomyces sp. AK08-02]MDX3747109.1 hypothetical protein [Streptomyces sp. AK08-02]